METEFGFRFLLYFDVLSSKMMHFSKDSNCLYLPIYHFECPMILTKQPQDNVFMNTAVLKLL